MINHDDVILMIDVETTNDIDCPIVYDVGYQIFSLSEGVLCERSFVNADIFLDKELMSTAYFIDKVPAYWDEIKSGQRILKSWRNIKKQLCLDCELFNVKYACAHNARFDYKALHTTQRYITTSKRRWVLPYGIEWLDTLKMSRTALPSEYERFCIENEYLTKNGCPRYTAEIIYRWLSGTNNFEESHTGLEDVKIERQIFEYCLAQNPELDCYLWAKKETV